MASRHSSANRLLASGLFDAVASFSDLEKQISDLSSNKDRGDAFEIFAEAYFATQKIAQAKEVWPFEAVPLEQRRELSLDTGRDMGVDGTYLTVDGELRAYQVKFRSRRAALTWEDLSTFMGLTDQVSQRVLFTNSETLPALMQDRSGFVPIRGNDLDRLTAEDFAAMHQWLQTGQVKLARKHPLPHQQEALSSITAGLRVQDRATIVMACGTGKSLVSLWAAEKYQCKTMLVLVPSLALVRQLLHEWLRETAWEQLTFMCVCSDPTVAKGADDVIVYQADLDFPVTTDSAVVSRFLAKHFDGVKLVFSTYQSAQVVAAGMPLDAEGKPQPFDLAIFDEAHKTASREGTRFSFALEDANLPIRKRLFFTATPRHYDVRKKDKEGDAVLAYSMDRTEIYGPVIHTLSFAEAARRGIICDYKVVISVVTSAMVDDELLKHGEVLVGGDVVKARQVALQIALQKAVERFGVSRIFTFHGSVAAARSFTSSDSEGIQQHLPHFTALHVSGEMATSRREDQMKAFRQADKAIISNARCLTEGVDVPAVDMVAFISPRKSKVDIVQATGRAMRKSPGKEYGYVMVPLFVEQANDESIEAALKRTGFDDVWDLLGAMREQDDVLIDIIRQMQEEKGRTGGYNDSRFSERVEVLGPSVSLETIRGAITAECLESLGVSWDERFGELLAYQEKFENVDIPINWATGLGVWSSVQRRSFKNGELSDSRRNRLNEVGFSWNKLDTQWEARLRELASYKAEHGDMHVPQKWSTGLGAWVSQQKLLEVNGELSADRRSLLEEIGFTWENRKQKSDWNDRFDELQKFKEAHKHIDVPRTWPTGLGTWVGNQKSFLKNGKLTQDRVDRLSEIGVIVESLETRWLGKYEELKEYQVKFGNLDVPHDWPTGLGQWIANQKSFEKSGKMSDDRKSLLQDLGIPMGQQSKKTDWEDRYAELAQYKTAYGDTDVPVDWPTGLGKWANKQRSAQLSETRHRMLSDLEFIWDKLSVKWDSRFDELLLYQETHGDANVPKEWPGGLGAWANTQRQAKKNEKLSTERILRLDAIGFVWLPRKRQDD